jgi:MFS transporter, DHA2 family, multidrug resistance protein
MLDRRQQFHQSRLVANITASSSQLQRILHGATQALVARGVSPSVAVHQAYGLVNAMVQRQASMLAYVDDFWMLGVASLVLIPLAFLTKKGPPGGEAPVH